MYEALTPLFHPGQSTRAPARGDLIRGLCDLAGTLMGHMGPGSAPLRGSAGMTEWSVAP